MVNIIKPSFEIIDKDEIDGIKILKKLEKIGRICYKSEDKITDNSAKNFIKMIIEKGHLSIIEHENISVKFIINRGISHELVRHRICSYSQESTRYIGYNKNKFNNEISVIEPFWLKKETDEYKEWFMNISDSEYRYFTLLKIFNQKPEQARGVLPNDLKTEIVCTTNLREWRHIFNLRCSKHAHPQMREIMLPLLEEFHNIIPITFDDLYNEYKNNINEFKTNED
jgi:thymidylate synthase (FAD)